MAESVPGLVQAGTSLVPGLEQRDHWGPLDTRAVNEPSCLRVRGRPLLGKALVGAFNKE